jgi:pSer/pThr/pTyr-binding forkhead associated (FHA) protein
MPAQLLALTDGPSILLDKPILLLGRHGECDVQLNSRKVSRRHCCVAQVHDYLVVRDLGSTNGVRINGHRVLEGKLQSGDELTVGNFRYQVYLEAPSSSEHSGSTPPPVPAQRPAGPRSMEARLEEAEEPVPLDDVTAAGDRVPAPKAARTAPPPLPAERKSDDDVFVLPERLRNPPPPRDLPQ